MKLRHLICTALIVVAGCQSTKPSNPKNTTENMRFSSTQELKSWMSGVRLYKQWIKQLQLASEENIQLYTDELNQKANNNYQLTHDIYQKLNEQTLPSLSALFDKSTDIEYTGVLRIDSFNYVTFSIQYERLALLSAIILDDEFKFVDVQHDVYKASELTHLYDLKANKPTQNLLLTLKNKNLNDRPTLQKLLTEEVLKNEVTLGMVARLAFIPSLKKRDPLAHYLAEFGHQQEQPYPDLLSYYDTKDALSTKLIEASKYHHTLFSHQTQYMMLYLAYYSAKNDYQKSLEYFWKIYRQDPNNTINLAFGVELFITFKQYDLAIQSLKVVEQQCQCTIDEETARASYDNEADFQLIKPFFESAQYQRFRATTPTHL